MSRTLRIDPELCGYLGSVSKFAEAELERQIIAGKGPREPIYVWKGYGIILDGHRRYKLCKKHGLDFRVVEIDLPNKDAARDWMDRHQFCRRNLSVMDEAKHVARLVAGAPGGAVEKVQAAADQAGKTVRSIYRDLNYVDGLEKITPEVRERMESGELDAGRATVAKLSAMPPAKQKQAAAKVDAGKCQTLGEAVSDKLSHAKKPREDYFREAARELGQFKKLLGDINAAFPSDEYKRAVAACNVVDKALATWRSA